MRRTFVGLGLAVLLAACGQATEKSESAVSELAADTPEARAKRQLEARLGAPATVSDLRQGTNDGKPVVCGRASAGGQERPFALRNGFLILPEDTTAAAFEALQAACAAPAAP